jgi:hypothetical protein
MKPATFHPTPTDRHRFPQILFAVALAVAAIAAPDAQSADGSKVDFENGALLYYDADCDGPHECTFAVVGCEYETPSILFSMDQKEVSRGLRNRMGI